jgi:hypothetical protein
MTPFQNNHNANLHSILPDSSPIVNFVDREDGRGVTYHVKRAPNKLFVKITNTIFNHNLKPRLLEFYCLLSYFTYSFPNKKLPMETIKTLIYQYTLQQWSVNTVNKYINQLIELGLISRYNQYYSIGYQLKNDEILTSNCYRIPKNKYSNFFITIYNKNTSKGSMGLEFYMSSKAYKNHRPKKVTQELSISTKTYYKYLSDIVNKNIVKKTKLNYNTFYYSNSYRKIIWDEYIEIKDARYYYKGHEWSTKIKTKTAHTRLWFASPMARVMKDYGINYIKAFDNYNPNDAYEIVQEIENQYRFNRVQLNAALIVKAIQDAYNWTKLQDRKHQKLKRQQRNHEIYLSYPENYVDYMMG